MRFRNLNVSLLGKGSLISCLFLSLLITGCQSPTEALREKLAKKMDTAQPAATIAAEKLFAEYKADHVAAEKKYRWKVIEVSGTVERVGFNVAEDVYVILEGEQGAGGVQCYFLYRHEKEAAQMQKGQKITVRGECTGYIINVILYDCKIMR